MLFQRLTIVLFIPFFLLSWNVYGSKDPCERALGAPSQKLVKLSKSFEFQGLTKEGLQALKEARDGLRTRIRLFDQRFRGLGAIHHAATVARLSKNHMMLYGPPGGAKSAVVNWMMAAEAEAPFKLQLHQMIPESAFTGGQNFEAAKEGRFEINTKGSMADYTVALIDEAEKGNPAALAALLSLLNEREILAGNQVIPARLETLFVTSNASLPELFQYFVENGQGSTAPALLNRIQLKAFTYNWLALQDQAILDERLARLRYLKALAPSFPEVLKDEVFVEAPQIDWASLRQLLSVLFEPSDLMMAVYRSLADQMRGATFEAVRASEQLHAQAPMDEPFVYYPSADFSERLRQQIPDIVLLSAGLDFLLSPLADDKVLEKMVSEKIQLDPLSLWRAYLVMTTLSSGETHLSLGPSLKGKSKGGSTIEVDFGQTLDPSRARDLREERLISNVRAEQERFQRIFLKLISEVQDQIKLRVTATREHPQDIQGTSFEALLSSHSGD